MGVPSIKRDAQMIKHLINILRVVLVVSGVTAKILDWMEEEQPSVAPTNHYYFIVVPRQPHAAAQHEGY